MPASRFVKFARTHSASIRRRGALCCAVAATSILARMAHAVPADHTIASFSDEFNGTSLDTTKWNAGVIDYQSGSTWLRRNHTGNNVVTGGNLVQTTIYQDVTGDGSNDWTCSSVAASKFRQRFGYWEARIQMTKYSYTDANFWSSDGSGVHLNGMDGFEIDAPEAWGTWRNSTTQGTGRYTSTIYDHNSALANAFEVPISTPDISATFNTYAWEWGTDNTVKAYFNGTLLYTHSAEAFNSIEALVPQSPVLGTAIWTTGLNSSNSVANGDQKLIDYVRVYQKPGWTGSTGNAWTTAANWGPDGVPGSGRAAVFNTTTANRTLTLSADQPVQELSFQTGAVGATSINGPGKLLLGATTAVNASNTAIGGVNINNDVHNSVTINASIVAQHKLQFSNYSGTTNFGGTNGVELILNGNLSAASASTDINFLTTGPIRVNGSIDQNIGAIVKGGQGTVYLNASNSFTGAIDHRDGQIVVTANGALGAITAGFELTQVSQYGSPALVFGNVNYTLAEPVVIQGSGNQGAGYADVEGAIDVAGVGTTASFAGPITLSDDATIGFGTTAQAANLTLSGTVSLAAHTLTLNGGGTLNITGRLSGSAVNGEGLIIKTGNGTANVTGNNTSYRGAWLFQKGVVSINNVAALGGATGEILQFDGGTLSLSGAVSTSKGGSFTGNNGTVDTGSLSFTSSGQFTGVGGPIKVGLGTLSFTGTTAYTGNSVATAGTLRFAKLHAPSTPGQLIANGQGRLLIDGGVVNASRATGTNLTIQSTGLLKLSPGGGPSGVGRLTGSVSIAGGSRFDLSNNALLLAGTATLNGSAITVNSLRNVLIAGRGGVGTGMGTWNGPGIMSSMFQDESLTSLGYLWTSDPELLAAALATVNGVTVSPGDYVVKYTRAADASLDGVVDDTDVAIIGLTYDGGATTGRHWYEGDFNYDGQVNDDDVAILGLGYDPSAGPLSPMASQSFSAAPAESVVTTASSVIHIVPEPASLGIIAGLGLLFQRRRTHSTK